MRNRLGWGRQERAPSRSNSCSTRKFHTLLKKKKLNSYKQASQFRIQGNKPWLKWCWRKEKERVRWELSLMEREERKVERYKGRARVCVFPFLGWALKPCTARLRALCNFSALQLDNGFASLRYHLLWVIKKSSLGKGYFSRALGCYRFFRSNRCIVSRKQTMRPNIDGAVSSLPLQTHGQRSACSGHHFSVARFLSRLHFDPSDVLYEFETNEIVQITFISAAEKRVYRNLCSHIIKFITIQRRGWQKVPAHPTAIRCLCSHWLSNGNGYPFEGCEDLSHTAFPISLLPDSSANALTVSFFLPGPVVMNCPVRCGHPWVLTAVMQGQTINKYLL